MHREASRMRQAFSSEGRAGFIICLGALLILAMPRASAGEDFGFDKQTKADLQKVVSGQLAAFERGDAAAAEAFATPAIKQKFADPADFLAMVKRDYGALIHPKSTVFTEVVPSPHGPLQKMTVVAADGRVWTAIYAFQRVDGAWRISACGLQKDDSQQDI
jgi:hypothetical protein